jgi:hypothetical protein
VLIPVRHSYAVSTGLLNSATVQHNIRTPNILRYIMKKKTYNVGKKLGEHEDTQIYQYRTMYNNCAHNFKQRTQHTTLQPPRRLLCNKL